MRTRYVLLIAVAVAVLAPAGAAQAAPTATAAKTCDITAVATTLGATQVTSLSVTKTTCPKGIKLVKAYQKCRTANGVSGRCVKKVQGYACREQRTTAGAEFTASVTCVNGKKTVKHAYRQTTA